MGQLSFASLDFAAKKKRTKRDVFMAENANCWLDTGPHGRPACRGVTNRQPALGDGRERERTFMFEVLAWALVGAVAGFLLSWNKTKLRTGAPVTAADPQAIRYIFRLRIWTALIFATLGAAIGAIIWLVITVLAALQGGAG
jgi:hypothetical protein